MGRWNVPAVGVFVALGLWLFSAAIFSGKVLGGDDLVLFDPPLHPPPGQTRPSNPYTFDSAWVLHPDMLVARRQLRDFQLPVWNPSQGAGQPLLASQQAAPLYPLNWLSDVLPFWQSLEWVALLKLLVAGVGTLLFARALGLGRWPSLFAAVSFTFSTYMVGWFAHPHSNVFVLLPWLMLTGDRAVSRARLRDALTFALVVGIALLGGHPESALLALLATGLWCTFRAATVRRTGGDWREVAWRVARFAGGVVLGLAIAAVALIPFAEMITQSQHASRSGGPGPLSMLQSFVLPEQWGRPDKFTLPGGPANYQERTAYFGALPLLFASAGLVLRRCATQVFFLVLGLLALGLVVDVPVYSALAAHLPGLDAIYRIRALIVCTFAGAILAGYGLQAVLGARLDWRRVLVAFALASAPLLLWVALHVDWSGRLSAALGQLPVLGHAREPRAVVELATALRWILLTCAGVAIAVVAARRPRLATGAAVVAVALTAADLVTLDRGYIPAIAAASADPQPPTAIRYAQAHLGHERVGGGGGLEPNLAERYGLRGSRIHALPALERRNKLWFGLGGDGLPQRLSSSPRDLASLFDVKYVFVAPGQRLADPQTRRVAPGLYENRAALPRAWVAYDWSPAVSADDAVRRLAVDAESGDVDTPVIEGASASPPRQDGRRMGPVRFVQDGDTSVELAVDARRPAWLVLGDTYYPGWRATVDGRPADIHAANVAFRAVRVPAGAHSVRFEYRPMSVRIGAWISAVALLVVLLGYAATSPRLRRLRTARRARPRPA